jgi:8-oxo-dGTP pyrophosphatase MutT (NUDIX family)
MAWNPEVTVAAVVERVIERERRYLMVEELISGRLVLNQPAGHLEEGEGLIEAVIRETREETAWRLQPEALVGVYLWRNPQNQRSFLRFAFCGSVSDHQPDQPLDTGIQRALWLSQAQLLAQPGRLRSPLVLRCLDDFLIGKRQPLETVATLDLESAAQIDAVVNL